MRPEELHAAVAQLYGPGLLSRVYIHCLSDDLGIPVAKVRQWWYGIRSAIPTDIHEGLEKIRVEWGRF
ncbi:MAG: hypothetical protein H7832_15305 [Magnetococcus sp. DMHC-6]